ncbi:DNA phosphorothioation-dependent restriction protein DptF, partial [Pseudomonadales bacterium]|nr:DNA phosphorothioation-dependent restriction protein DptF [Pseudomonadales bacterium]
MKLKNALSMLSRSSPHAVSTAGAIDDPALEKIKRYLYVETDIERAFRDKLHNLKPNEILFLCGSSGDGKSEILTRYRKEYADKANFHLDATHSFEPKKTAVDTLNNIFTDFYEADKPLVIGINIGMLGNFEREGDDSHYSIKLAIKDFLEGKKVEGDYAFIDFEAFPKFQIVDGEVASEFFSTLLDKIVMDDSRNPFRDYFNRAASGVNDKKIVANILLLRNRAVQKTVVELLLNARIRKDQFITARMLLDFIYCILTGSGYLFDNIFSGGENELLDVLKNFDPSFIRNKELDLFVIHRTLGFEEGLYTDFSNELERRFNVIEELSPQSVIRCFYLLKNAELDNNYQRNFSNSFNEEALVLYKKVWQQHKDYDGSNEKKAAIKSFYNDIFLVAINKYANRNAPYLTKDEFYIASHGGSDLAAEVDLSIAYSRIEKDDFHDVSHFKLHINVNDESLPSVPVNVNLLSMMLHVV